MYEPPDEVVAHFIESGWVHDRRVVVPKQVPANHPAFEILRRYSGLTVGSGGEGSEVLAGDIEFRIPESDNPESFDQKPMWEDVLQTKLISIGHVHNQHGELLVDDKGRCIGRSYIHVAVWLEGLTFERALKNILLGNRVRPMLLPYQPSVTVYGKKYDQTSPEIYDWSKP